MNQDLSNFKPGWQILEDSAHAALEAEPTAESAKFFEIQLLARAKELIPDHEKTRLMPGLVATCCHLYGKAQLWPVLMTHFFHSQVGRQGLASLLTDGVWELRDHPQVEDGYLVINTEYRAPITADDVRVAQALGFRGHLERGKSGVLLASRG